jgi:hypothetical protein
METIKFDGCVEFDQIGNLPDIHAMYFVLSNKRLLYVGVSFVLRTRLKSHKNSKLFYYFNPTHVKWIEYSKSQAKKLSCDEKIFVEKFKPPLNKASGGCCTRRVTSQVGRRNVLRCKSKTFEIVYNLIWNEIEDSLSKMFVINEISRITEVPKSNIHSISNGGTSLLDKIEDLKFETFLKLYIYFKIKNLKFEWNI